MQPQTTERPILAHLMGEVIQSLMDIKRGYKGFKIPFISIVSMVGYSEGLGCAAYARIMGQTRLCIYRRLFRAIENGFIYKSEGKYYLTEKGKFCFQLVDNRLKQSLNRVESEIVSSIRKRLAKG